MVVLIIIKPISEAISTLKQRLKEGGSMPIIIFINLFLLLLHLSFSVDILFADAYFGEASRFYEIFIKFLKTHAYASERFFCIPLASSAIAVVLTGFLFHCRCCFFWKNAGAAENGQAEGFGARSEVN